MTICGYCNKVKYWFQFVVVWECEHHWRSTLCRKCARKIARKAVKEAADKLQYRKVNNV